APVVAPVGRQHTAWTCALDQLQAVDLYGAPVGGASALLIERVCTGTADLFFQVCVLPSHGWRRRCRSCDACGNQIADMANSTTSAPPHLLARFCLRGFWRRQPHPINRHIIVHDEA